MTRESLEAAALRYLDRFDATVAKLRKVLEAHVARAARVHGADAGSALWIDELLERYAASGLLNDERYATALAERQRARGASRRNIAHKLQARGVATGAIESALGNDEVGTPEAEHQAAQVFARKRKLGPYRPEAERAARRQRDFAAMARAGFSYELARRVLGSSGDDGDAF